MPGEKPAFDHLESDCRKIVLIHAEQIAPAELRSSVRNVARVISLQKSGCIRDFGDVLDLLERLVRYRQKAIGNPAVIELVIPVALFDADGHGVRPAADKVLFDLFVRSFDR